MKVENDFKWVPIKWRDMTAEEIDELSEEVKEALDGDFRCFDCELPDEDEEILVCSRFGNVWIDRLDYDCDYGYGLEVNGDFSAIVAWARIPKFHGVET